MEGANSETSSQRKSTGSINVPHTEDGQMVLHNSDQPRMVLETSPLTGTNYFTWSITMKTSVEQERYRVSLGPQLYKSKGKDQILNLGPLLGVGKTYAMVASAEG
ncbi:uncharacterized protein G2W53_004458 [Senna tora]|uniref:Retrotransposon Copia-like N-terminal domain-containing protein n=1 Tax=Senna tora TaxID=362788 RepID=A0A835CJD2_9FABA|nr:uncharacterized protein G2W53_004458 [Senna tora]